MCAPRARPNPIPFIDPSDLTGAISGPLSKAGQIFEVVTLAVVSQVAESAVNAMSQSKRKTSKQYSRPLKSLQSRRKPLKTYEKQKEEKKYAHNHTSKIDPR